MSADIVHIGPVPTLARDENGFEQWRGALLHLVEFGMAIEGSSWEIVQQAPSDVLWFAVHSISPPLQGCLEKVVGGMDPFSAAILVLHDLTSSDDPWSRAAWFALGWLMALREAHALTDEDRVPDHVMQKVREWFDSDELALDAWLGRKHDGITLVEDSATVEFIAECRVRLEKLRDVAKALVAESPVGMRMLAQVLADYGEGARNISTLAPKHYQAVLTALMAERAK